MKKPTPAQMKLLNALRNGPESYSVWGGTAWTATPARATLATIGACEKAGWIFKKYCQSEIQLSLTKLGREQLTSE